MLAYVPAGTPAEIPRKTESLCTLVRSTMYVVAFRGMLTAEPVEGVREIPTMSTAKARRFAPGGASGVATKVTPTMALPLPQLIVQGPPLVPLQPVRRGMETTKAMGRNLRNIVEHPMVIVQTRIQDTTLGGAC